MHLHKICAHAQTSQQPLCFRANRDYHDSDELGLLGFPIMEAECALKGKL